jgi:hypothetical protein
MNEEGEQRVRYLHGLGTAEGVIVIRREGQWGFVTREEDLIFLETLGRFWKKDEICAE